MWRPDVNLHLHRLPGRERLHVGRVICELVPLAHEELARGGVEVLLRGGVLLQLLLVAVGVALLVVEWLLAAGCLEGVSDWSGWRGCHDAVASGEGDDCCEGCNGLHF